MEVVERFVVRTRGKYEFISVLVNARCVDNWRELPISSKKFSLRHCFPCDRKLRLAEIDGVLFLGCKDCKIKWRVDFRDIGKCCGQEMGLFRVKHVDFHDQSKPATFPSFTVICSVCDKMKGAPPVVVPKTLGELVSSFPKVQR